MSASQPSQVQLKIRANVDRLQRLKIDYAQAGWGAKSEIAGAAINLAVDTVALLMIEQERLNQVLAEIQGKGEA